MGVGFNSEDDENILQTLCGLTMDFLESPLLIFVLQPVFKYTLRI